MNIRGIFTATTESGRWSWTVIAGWLVVLAGVLDLILQQGLLAQHADKIVIALGILKLVLRGKTMVPLDTNATQFARMVSSKKP